MSQPRTARDWTTIRIVAAKAGCDPRGALAVFEGRRVMHVTRIAVERAARELGLAHLIPAAPASLAQSFASPAMAISHSGVTR